jgi:phosphatidylserine/phosphatidylglycerophosphate/cardiolipin synthase-like enzyme
VGTIYSGIVGVHVLPSLRAATRSLDIVSPYLSPEYAQLLLSKARSGVVVRLVTSDSNGRRHQQALRMLGQSTGGYSLDRRFWRLFSVAVLLGICGIVLGNQAGILLLTFSLIVAVAALAKNLTKKRGSIAQLFVKVVASTQLVHVKLYIIDRQIAFTGSANLTYYGMNRNIEQIEMKTLPSEVQTEIGVFSNIWGPQPTPVIPSTGASAVASPTQPKGKLITENMMTREEAETLEELYSGFQPVSRTVTLSPVGRTAATRSRPTWQERVRSALRKLFS